MKFKYYISVIIILIALYSCKNASNEPVVNPLDGLTKLKEGYAIGAALKVELWGKKNFSVGYNNLTVVLYDSLKHQEKITDAHIHFEPLLTAGNSIQASPTENPNETPVNDVFPGAISFMKATDSFNSWKLGIVVHNHKYDKEGEAIFDIAVDNTTASQVKTVTSTSADSTQFALTLIKPVVAKEGTNELEFLLNQNVGSAGWTTDDSYTVEINTEMPDMWYSTHSFIATKYTGNGHYTGSFDISMGGEWRINVNVKQNGLLLSKSLYFTLKI